MVTDSSIFLIVAGFRPIGNTPVQPTPIPINARPLLTSLSDVNVFAIILGCLVIGLVTPVESIIFEVLTAHNASAVKQSFIESCTSAIQTLSKPTASAC